MNYSTKQRRGYAIVKGICVFQTEFDDKSTLDWLKSDIGLSDEEIENTVRGGIMESRINMFVGSDYSPVDLDTITAFQLLTILNMHTVTYPNANGVMLYNGCVVGEPGEVWEPVATVGLCSFKCITNE